MNFFRTLKKMYDKYLGLVALALLIAILHCANPKLLQEKHDGKPNGRPNIILIVLVSLVAVMAALYLISAQAKGKSFLDL
jgi:hypothetical protein